MHIANLLLLGAGLILQTVLVVVLWRRRLALAVPSFTLLIVFYLLRSICLFLLSNKLQRTELGELYDALALVDLGLQLLVAAEITFQILRKAGKRTWAYGSKITALCALSIAAAAAISIAIPARGRLAADRGSAFAAILMLLIFVWARVVRANWMLRMVTGGFALFGIAGIATGMMRSHAITHRQMVTYAVGSYIEIAIYLGVILFWISQVWKSQRNTVPVTV